MFKVELLRKYTHPYIHLRHNIIIAVKIMFSTKIINHYIHHQMVSSIRNPLTIHSYFQKNYSISHQIITKYQNSIQFLCIFFLWKLCPVLIYESFYIFFGLFEDKVFAMISLLSKYNSFYPLLWYKEIY